MNKGLAFTGLGFELVGIILGCLYLGGVIDKEFSWPGYGVTAMVIIGTISWLYRLILMLKRLTPSETEEKLDKNQTRNTD